jgi:hypothetical protein
MIDFNINKDIFRFSNDKENCPTFERIDEKAFLLFYKGEIVPRNIDCRDYMKMTRANHVDNSGS